MAANGHPGVDAYIAGYPRGRRAVHRAAWADQGTGNATARAIQIYEREVLNRPAITELVRAIAARNRAGGWRRPAKGG